VNVPIFRKRHPPAGSRPGTLVVPEGSPAPRIRAICYAADAIEEHEDLDPDALSRLAVDGRVTWIDIQGLGDEPLLRRVGAAFNIHPLALEDIVNAPQRPKAEEYENNLLLITRMPGITPARAVDVEQVAVLVGRTYVLSVQERYGDCLDPIRKRLREGVGPMRGSGPDYLAYAIVDAIIDAYYPIIEQLSNRITRAETVVMAHPTPRLLDRINRIKNDLVQIRRGVWPQQETLTRLLRDPGRFMSPGVVPYLRDTLDHCAQLVDVVDSHRDLANALVNTYLSALSNRTNDVMKVLTIMASIFIPLTFIAGIYGMNFHDMPELNARWAYPTVLAVMVVTAAGLLLYFRRRGWLGSLPEADDWDEKDE